MAHLNEKDIEAICSILDGWSGKLTWEALIAETGKRIGQEFTRQTFNRHTRIKKAYDLRKVALRDNHGRPEVRSVELQKALEVIDRLRAENQRLKAENDRLLERFVRWSNNSISRGVTMEQLDHPLVPVDRARTKK